MLFVFQSMTHSKKIRQFFVEKIILKHSFLKSASFGAAALLICAVASSRIALSASQTLYDATFGAGSFVSVGANGIILSSINGGPWESRVSGVTNDLTT